MSRYGGGNDRRFGDGFRDRMWYGDGGGDRFGGGGGRFGGGGDRFGGHGGRHEGPPGKGRQDKFGGADKKTRRGSRGGKNRQKDDKGKRKASESADDTPSKKLKPGNNWHGEDRHPLMQAIPMESRPEDFEDAWKFVVCPPGRKRIVVAANNVTQSYNNASTPDMKFESMIPSGNEDRDEMFKQQDLCVLDTIYSLDEKKYYVFDMLHWRHYPYYDTEAEFRYFCLQEKWSQLPSPEEKSSSHDFPFQLLSRHHCSDESIVDALKNFGGQIDKLLFIKKDSTYSPHESPNLLKLKLDSLKQVLGIEVPEGVDFIPGKKLEEIKTPKEKESTEINEETEIKEETEENSPEKQESDDVAMDNNGEVSNESEAEGQEESNASNENVDN